MKPYDNLLITTGYLDTSSSAGGDHLTLKSVLRYLATKGTRPKFFVARDLDNKTKPYLKELGYSPLDQASATSFAGLPSTKTFCYGWGNDSAAMIESLKPSHFFVRHSALGAPLCSNGLKQANGCWNDCGPVAYILHMPRSVRGFLNGLQGALGINCWNRADGYSFATKRIAELYERRFPSIANKSCFITKAVIEFNKETKNILGWETIPEAAEPAILLVSKWESHKGLLEALEMLTKLAFPIYVVGGGSEVSIAQSKYSNSKVNFLGSIPQQEIFSKLPKHRFLYLHPARWFEALGRTTIEAMYAGIPVLIPKDSGIVDELTPSDYRYTYNRKELGRIGPQIQGIFDISPESKHSQSSYLAQEVMQFEMEQVMGTWSKYLG